MHVEGTIRRSIRQSVWKSEFLVAKGNVWLERLHPRREAVTTCCDRQAPWRNQHSWVNKGKITELLYKEE